jgi:glycosyltransferase involved in cell wall biosynthesis
MPSVVAAFPNAKLRLVGKNLLGRALKDDITDQKLEKNIAVLGFLHETLRRREMAHAAIVVVPSVLEGFGLVAAEAMALGCAVIVTDCPGLNSLVRHNQTGILIPANDAKALAASISDLLSNPKKAEALGGAAKAEAAVRFRYERGVAEMQVIYDKVTKKNN